MGSAPSVFAHVRHRLELAADWRLKALWEQADKKLVHFGLETLINAHWPWPMRKPWEKSSLTLAGPKGVGDELLATPVFREIKRRNPGCYLRFATSHMELMRGNPHVDELIPFNELKPKEVHWLTYRQTIPPIYPLATMMAASVGILMEQPGPIEPPRLEDDVALDERIASIPEPRIVIQTLTSRWTQYKNWFPESWEAILPRLLELGNVIDTGVESVFSARDFGPRFHSFVGQTDVAGFARLVRGASAFVGPVSAGMHLAAAFNIPSVIIFGGYEYPAGYSLPDAICLTGEVSCSPCWRRDGCPYDRKCLDKIKPAAVIEAAEKQIELWHSEKRSS